MVTADEYVARIESAAFGEESWAEADRAWWRARALGLAPVSMREHAWGRYSAVHAAIDAKRARYWRVRLMLAKIRGL